MSLYSIILAAGEGRRFGGDIKQLALINGESFLQRVTRIASAITPGRVNIVLGFQHELLRPFVKDVNVITHADWAEGIGSSIACGVIHLPLDATAVLILLCDQVALTLEHYTQLSNCYYDFFKKNAGESAPIVCSSYAGSIGVPAIFPKDYFSQLRDLKGDAGAKKILCTNSVVSVPLEDAVIDIDTQENLADFLIGQE